MNDALLPEIAPLAISVKDGVGEVGIELGKGLGNEDGVVGDVAGALIGDRDGPRPAADLHFCQTDDRAERLAGVDDRHGAFGLVGYIENRAVRRQGTAPGLGAHLELGHYPALTEVDDRDRTANGIGDISRPTGGVNGYAARLFTNCYFGNLAADVVAVCILDLDDRYTVGLAIDNDQTLLVRGQRDRGRASRCRIAGPHHALRDGECGCHRYQYRWPAKSGGQNSRPSVSGIFHEYPPGVSLGIKSREMCTRHQAYILHPENIVQISGTSLQWCQGIPGQRSLGDAAFHSLLGWSPSDQLWSRKGIPADDRDRLSGPRINGWHIVRLRSPTDDHPRSPPGRRSSAAADQAARRRVSRVQTSARARTSSSMSATLCNGVGVRRNRSVPHGTVG